MCTQWDYQCSSKRHVCTNIVCMVSVSTNSLASCLHSQLWRCRGFSAWVDNSYDQAQLRYIKMADARHGEFRQSRIASDSPRSPSILRLERVMRPIDVWSRETTTTGLDIEDFGRRKFRRNHRNRHNRKWVIGRNCRVWLIVTAMTWA